jgi:dTDP-4-amino-4,6-dideoxygalactose transaminase
MTYWNERYHYEPRDFPVASRYFAGAVTLPLFAGMTDAEVDRVVAVVREILR